VDSRSVRLIPPKGCSFAGKATKTRSRRRTASRTSSATSKPSFFSSSAAVVRRLAGLTDDELEAVLAARERWLSEGEALEENLDPELVTRLRAAFSFQESGVTTIVATALSPDGEIQRTLRMTRDCRPTRAAFADARREYLSLWEWFLF